MSLIPRARPSRLFPLIAATLVLLALAATTTDTAHAEDSEEFVLRVAARLNPDGRLEFGIQRIDDEGAPRLLHLEHERFFPQDVTHHQWLRGSATFLVQAPHYDLKGRDPSLPSGTRSAKARVIARVHPTDGRVEFAVQHELDLDQRTVWYEDYSEPVFTTKRFFPSDVTHNRWLYSTEIRFTRAWADDSMMEAEPTLDPEVEEGPSTPPPPSTLEQCLADIAQSIEAMLSERCTDILMPAYCAEHPDFAWCDPRKIGG